MAVAFDTPAFHDRLRAGGFPEPQAKAATEAIDGPVPLLIGQTELLAALVGLLRRRPEAARPAPHAPSSSSRNGISGRSASGIGRSRRARGRTQRSCWPSRPRGSPCQRRQTQSGINSSNAS